MICPDELWIVLLVRTAAVWIAWFTHVGLEEETHASWKWNANCKAFKPMHDFIDYSLHVCFVNPIKVEVNILEATTKSDQELAHLCEHWSA